MVTATRRSSVTATSTVHWVPTTLTKQEQDTVKQSLTQTELGGGSTPTLFELLNETGEVMDTYPHTSLADAVSTWVRKTRMGPTPLWVPTPPRI